MTEITNRATLMAFVEEAEQIITRYGWQDRETRPYPNCPITASKILKDCKDYDNCTEGSREYLIQLAEGFRPILEEWERYELAPKVKVRIKKTGRIVELEKSDDGFVQFLIDEGLVELI